MVLQAAPGEPSKEGMVRGSYTPWDASWAHRVATSLCLQHAFQACRAQTYCTSEMQTFRSREKHLAVIQVVAERQEGEGTLE